MTLPMKYKYYKTTYHLFSATAAFDLLSLLPFCSITSSTSLKSAHKPNRISHLVCLASNDHVTSQTIIYSHADLSLLLNHEFPDLAYLTKEIQRISREDRVSSLPYFL